MNKPFWTFQSLLCLSNAQWVWKSGISPRLFQLHFLYSTDWLLQQPLSLEGSPLTDFSISRSVFTGFLFRFFRLFIRLHFSIVVSLHPYSCPLDLFSKYLTLPCSGPGRFLSQWMGLLFLDPKCPNAFQWLYSLIAWLLPVIRAKAFVWGYLPCSRSKFVWFPDLGFKVLDVKCRAFQIYVGT